jgi:DNA-binding LacI/PurR family transcriptional regulator
VLLLGSVNIKDIARIAGVGVATVSRVVNNTGVVSAATRDKVLEVIREYGYVPNNSARNLKLSQSKTIALLVKGFTNPLFVLMMKEAEQQVNLRGYTLLVQATEEERDAPNLALELAKEKNLCGIIFLGGNHNCSEEKFKQIGVPCVFVSSTTDASMNPELFSSVTIDDLDSCYDVVNYLISLNHRKICFLAEDVMKENTVGSRRLSAYRKALEENGIPYDPQLVEECKFDMESGFSVTKKILARKLGFTAMFAASDYIAIGAAKAILVSGLTIPDDISVVGFDGVEETEYFHPSLDTVKQPGIQMIDLGVSKLFDLLSEEAKTEHIILNASLVRRGSCKALRI